MTPSKSELDALKSLKNNSVITTCKPDKGNWVVVLNHSDYCQKINQLLNDTSKFVELPDDPTITREKKQHEYLYYLKGALDDSTYQTIRPQGSKPGRNLRPSQDPQRWQSTSTYSFLHWDLYI